MLPSASVWFLSDRIRIHPGTVLRIGYQRRVSGKPDGLTCQVIEP